MSSESTSSPNYPRRPPRFIRVIRTRPRLSVSVAVGLIATAVLFAVTVWRTPTKLLTGWDIGVVLYLVLAFSLMARSDLHRLKRRAANQDEGNIAILFLIVAAAIASLGAIFAELGTVGGASRTPGQLLLATATVVIPPSRKRVPSPRPSTPLHHRGDGTRLLLRGRSI